MLLNGMIIHKDKILDVKDIKGKIKKKKKN
jgi:hypothetical protein